MKQRWRNFLFPEFHAELMRFLKILFGFRKVGIDVHIIAGILNMGFLTATKILENRDFPVGLVCAVMAPKISAI